MSKVVIPIFLFLKREKKNIKVVVWYQMPCDQGRNFVPISLVRSPPPPNVGLSPPMLVRKGVKFEEKPDFIRLLMAP